MKGSNVVKDQLLILITAFPVDEAGADPGFDRGGAQVQNHEVW